MILDSRTIQSTAENGARAGYDGHKRKRRKGSKVHGAVDTLGELLALVAELAAVVQAVTGETVELAYVDHGYTGPTPAEATLALGIVLAVVKLPEAKRGFVLLPRRWVIERSFAWTFRFRRLARDYEHLEQTLAGLHLLQLYVTRLRHKV